MLKFKSLQRVKLMINWRVPKNLHEPADSQNKIIKKWNNLDVVKKTHPAIVIVYIS